MEGKKDMIMTLEAVTARLKDRKTNVIAKKIGIPYAAVWKVATGRHDGVRYEVVKALSDYFQEEMAALNVGPN